MAIYYYEDQNGKYSSHTDARRFSRVSGKEAYAYYNHPQKGVETWQQ